MSNEIKTLDIKVRSAIEVLKNPPRLSSDNNTRTIYDMQEECMNGTYGDLEPSTTTSLENVREFHEKFDCERRESPEIPAGPSDQSLQVAFDKLMLVREYLRQVAKQDVRCQRVALAVEELAELTKALKDRNLVSALDALGDIEYINNGSAVSFGFYNVLPTACQRIHESNMSKLGEDGLPVKDTTGKVIKGPNYKPVDLTDLVCQGK